LRRYDCLKHLARRAADDLVVTNLANTATEWHTLRPHDGNLLCVGMGMVTAYAIGLALALPDRPVIALDGDGGILFDISVLGTLAQTAPANLRVLVFDNGGYASTGRLPHVASMTSGTVRIEDLARAFGLARVTTVSTEAEFEAALDAPAGRPQLIVARVNAEQAFVGALPQDLKENKYRFVRHVERLEGRRLLKPSGKEHGAAPPPDPRSGAVADQELGEVLRDGLLECGTDFVVGLPCSGLSRAQQLCAESPGLTYVPVANEGTGLGLCAGAWLGGRRPAAVIENFGIFAATYQLLRGHYSYGIPTLLIGEYRGDTGDQEFFAESGELTEPLLAALRVNTRVLDSAAALKPAMRDAWRWMDACLRPFALLPRFDLTRPKPKA
jgi:sulfopyruvate decarboxylase TPP-binding subunit